MRMAGDTKAQKLAKGKQEPAAIFDSPVWCNANEEIQTKARRRALHSDRLGRRLSYHLERGEALLFRQCRSGEPGTFRKT